MKLAHYLRSGQVRVGIVNDGFIFDVADAAKKSGLTIGIDPLTIDGVLSGGRLEFVRSLQRQIPDSASGVPVDEVKLLSPILNPEKIFLLAVNYAAHGEEQNMKPPAEPYVFTKFRNSLIGPGDPILLSKVSKKVDWEVELAVVIGKAGKYITKKDALNYVAGYAVANDVSFRDFQNSTKLPDGKTTQGLNWVKGKGLDSAFPVGPWLVMKDEIADPHDLDISLSVNGKEKQRSNTREMIFKIDSLIEYISAGITLRPGDIISTGTPEGVAMYTGEPFLKDGDTVEGTIDRIGSLRNPVMAERD